MTTQTNNDWHIALPGCTPYMISQQPPGRQKERNETEDFTLVEQKIKIMCFATVLLLNSNPERQLCGQYNYQTVSSVVKKKKKKFPFFRNQSTFVWQKCYLLIKTQFSIFIKFYQFSQT